MIIWILSAILSVIAVVFIIMWTTILVARVAILVEDIRNNLREVGTRFCR